MFPRFVELLSASELECGKKAFEKEIVLVEEKIGARLSNDYRHLITKFGFLEPIFDLGQIEAYTQRLRKEMGFPPPLIPYQESEGEAFFVFDSSRPDADGTQPVLFYDSTAVESFHFTAFPHDYKVADEPFVAHLRDLLVAFTYGE